LNLFKKGQLGVGNTNIQNIPTLIQNNNFNIIGISCGSETSKIIQSQFSCFGKAPSDANLCSGKGICVGSNECSCASGYYGPQCQVFNCFEKNNTDSMVCSGNGFCSKPDDCTCNTNYDGRNCQHFINPQNQKKMYTFGSNAEGDLGIGNTVNKEVPTLVSGVYPGVTRIFPSNDNAAYFVTKSWLYGFGKNRVYFHIFDYFRIIN
jgi:hypothetical protein